MNEKGKKYEDIACEYIKDKLRYKILERNFRIKFGEIDIIAEHKKCLIFIEVKGGKGFILPRLRVNETKIKKIEITANYYIKNQNKIYKEIRVDVIEILDNGEISYFEGISRW